MDDIDSMMDEFIFLTNKKRVELFFRKYFMINEDEYFDFNFVSGLGLIQFNFETRHEKNTYIEINSVPMETFKGAIEMIKEKMKEKNMTTITG